MVDKTSLGDRMKGYEAVSQDILMKRTPVIIRVDGRAFHTFTRRFKEFDPNLKDSPFSHCMQHCMQSAAVFLTHYIQGARISYVQSDEISVLLTDWNTYESEQWFGGKIQKIVSIASAMASTAFYSMYEQYEKIDYMPHRPLFDARVFNLPMEEVTNYFIWRQQDAMRNSVNMLGRFYFSAKQLHGKKNADVKEMMLEKEVDWNVIPTWQQRGFCIPSKIAISSAMCTPDSEIPVFTEDRDYIERWLGNYQGEM